MIEIDEKEKIFKEGQKAFLSGKKECPYQKENWRRVEWWSGWYNSKIGTELKAVFERHRIEWP